MTYLSVPTVALLEGNARTYPFLNYPSLQSKAMTYPSLQSKAMTYPSLQSKAMTYPSLQSKAMTYPSDPCSRTLLNLELSFSIIICVSVVCLSVPIALLEGNARSII